MEKYLLFIIDECSFCTKAILLLEKHFIIYKIVDVTDDLNIRVQLKKAFGWSTFPIILKQNENTFDLIGGHSDLEKYVRTHGTR